MKWPFLFSSQLYESEAYYFCDFSYFLIKKKLSSNLEEKEHKHPKCQVSGDDLENVSSICLGRLQSIPSGYLLPTSLMGCGISPESTQRLHCQSGYGILCRLLLMLLFRCFSLSAFDWTLSSVI